MQADVRREKALSFSKAKEYAPRQKEDDNNDELYNRNIIGTIVSLGIAALIVSTALAFLIAVMRQLYLDNLGVREDMPFSYNIYSLLVFFANFGELALSVWLCLVFWEALTDPLIIHGPSAKNNLVAFRYYLIALVGMFLCTNLFSVMYAPPTDQVDDTLNGGGGFNFSANRLLLLIMSGGKTLMLNFVPILLVYLGWSQKGRQTGANETIATLTQPFVPKP